MFGNRTLFDIDPSKANQAAVHEEIKETTLALSSIIGHQTILFKAPQTIDGNPLLRQMSDGGYVFVGADIDSRDMQEFSADKAYASVQSKASASGAIVLHGAGDKKDQILATLDTLIPKLQSE
jgi:hypothetical protein